MTDTSLPVSSPSSTKVEFVVADVEMACSRVSSICEVGIVGFREGVEVFDHETLVNRDARHPMTLAARM